MRYTLGFSLLTSSVHLASLLDTVYASYGNYPCGSPSGLSVQMVPDQSKCVGSTNMGSGGQCVRISNDDFACGVQGAVCITDDGCDGGQCEGTFPGSSCTGGPGFVLGLGQRCLGRLEHFNYDDVDLGVCGGNGVACGIRLTVEGGAISYIQTDDSLCDSNYCNRATGLCAATGSPGYPCSSNFGCRSPSACGMDSEGNMVCGADGTTCSILSNYPGDFFPPDNSACISGYCNPDSVKCDQRPPTPSGRARQRRNQIALARKCPPQQEACSLAGSFGYECVDTMSNIERCGSCDGNDCTELPGVDRVNCSEGSCIILSCAPGSRYDKINKVCIPSKHK